MLGTSAQAADRDEQVHTYPYMVVHHSMDACSVCCRRLASASCQGPGSREDSDEQAGGRGARGEGGDERCMRTWTSSRAGRSLRRCDVQRAIAQAGGRCRDVGTRKSGEQHIGRLYIRDEVYHVTGQRVCTEYDEYKNAYSTAMLSSSWMLRGVQSEVGNGWGRG